MLSSVALRKIQLNRVFIMAKGQAKQSFNALPHQPLHHHRLVDTNEHRKLLPSLYSSNASSSQAILQLYYDFANLNEN